MRLSTSLRQMTKLLYRFGSAQNGNVAIIFGLAIIPILAGVGSAIDFSLASDVKAKMQYAADSAGLSLQKNAPTLSKADLQSAASGYFNAVFTAKDVENLQVKASYSVAGGSRVVVTATADVPTVFMNIFGYDQIPLSVSTTAKWGNSRLRVALVLDNTGSMAQSGKMAALKTATKNLLSQLQGAATNDGDVYVSIIPFNKDVNLDSVNYNAPWIDWAAWDQANTVTQTTTVCNTGGGNGHGHGYGGGGGGGGDHGDGNGWNGNGGGNNGCQTTTVQVPANHNTWNGCVTDRGSDSGPDPANYDTNVVEPTTSIKATLFTAEQYSSCPEAAKGLSYDWSAMNTLVDNMSSNGNTNQAIGLALGWMSIAGGGPFTAPPLDPNYKYQQVVILLTDGLNTEDRWYKNQSQIDARQTMTCDNIKAAGIELYTIQVNTGGDPTSTLLQSCASAPNRFFLLTSANQIVTTFDQIGTNLTKLYLAQ